MQYSLNELKNIKNNLSAIAGKIYEQVDGQNVYVGAIGGSLSKITKGQAAILTNNPRPSVLPKPAIPSPVVDDDLPTTKEGIVAFAGGGQLNATVLTDNFNMVDTVATNGDSVKCDQATVSAEKSIFNTTANDMNLYPKIGERFQNGTNLMAINAPISLGGGNGLKLVCFKIGIWRFT